MITEKIYEQIKSEGLMATIKNAFGVGAKIRLPFTEKACETPIEELNLSVRSYNSLKRVGVNNVGKVVEYMQNDKLLTIRNLGKNSKKEIHVKIYEFGYNRLSEKGKKAFIQDLYDLNESKYNRGKFL